MMPLMSCNTIRVLKSRRRESIGGDVNALAMIAITPKRVQLAILMNNRTQKMAQVGEHQESDACVVPLVPSDAVNPTTDIYRSSTTGQNLIINTLQVLLLSSINESVSEITCNPL